MAHSHLHPFLLPLQALCRRFGVQEMYLFGSAVTPQLNPARSDADVLAQLPPLSPLAEGETLLQLWEALETLLQRRVDLLTPGSMQNPFLRAEIDRTKQLIYDAARTAIPV